MATDLKPFKFNSLQIGRLREAEKVLAHLKSELERARDAGLDVTERTNKFLTMEEQLKGMLRVFG